jgi:nucleoside-diphosphate-sugar epimerase
MDETKGTVLVTGANGFIGSHLAEGLLARGYTVRCMVRPSSNLRHVEDLPIDFFYADLHQPDGLWEACRGVDAVFHSAALTRALDEETFQRVNTQGTLLLAQACLAANGQSARFVFVSSQAAAGPSTGPDDLIDEQRLPSPVTWYGKSKWAAEQALLEMAPDLPLTIVRPAPVFGPRDMDFFAYFQLVKRGLSLELGQGERRLSLVYVVDLAEMIIRSWESDAALGQTYFGTTFATSYAELSASIARAMGKNPLTIRVPVALLTPVALWSKVQGKITGRPALINNQRVLDMRQRNWLCSGEKAERDLDFKPDADMDSLVKATVDWYEENGWL